MIAAAVVTRVTNRTSVVIGAGMATFCARNSSVMRGCPSCGAHDLHQSALADLFEQAHSSQVKIYCALRRVACPSVEHGDGAEYVERGQLLRMHVADWYAVYAAGL